MSKNIGWTKKVATHIAKGLNGSYFQGKNLLEAFTQREDHWYDGVTKPRSSHQWIVVLQKKSRT